MRNIPKKELEYQIKITRDEITAKSGLAILYESAKRIGIIEEINKIFPKPGSNRGIKAQEYVMTIILMLSGGGKYMEDMREIKLDSGLCRICGIKKIPSPDAIEDFLKNRKNLARLRKIVEYLNKEIIKKDSTTEYTLDTDATIIETEKGGATMTYKGVKGYSCLLSFIVELDLCLIDEYRDGSNHAGEGIVEQIIYADEIIKSTGKKTKYFRSDSAGYTADVINECNDRKIIFTITADKDKAVKEVINEISGEEWKELKDEEGKETGREYAEAIHCMNKSKESFKLIVQRWEDKQMSLIPEYKYNYYVIATNDNTREESEIIWFHNKRGNSENYNKELKNGFGMEYVPTHDKEANAVYFRLGVISYNLTIAVKRLFLGGDWIKKKIDTLRWQFFFIAGKVINHGRQLFLKVSKSYYDLLCYVRNNIKSYLSSA